MRSFLICDRSLGRLVGDRGEALNMPFTFTWPDGRRSRSQTQLRQINEFV